MTKKKHESTEIQTTGPTSIQVHDYGDDAVDIGQVAPGYEHQTSQDTTVPFVKLAQPMTPEVSEQKVPGLMPGMWFNPITGQIWQNPGGLIIVCATTRHDFGEWKPRNEGGGLVGRYDIDSEIIAKAKAESKKYGKYKHPETGNDLVETFYMFGAVCDEESALGMAVVAFKSTMIKAYKNAMSMVRAHTITVDGKKRTPPLFAHLMRFTTTFEKNNEGSWWEPHYAPAKGSVAESLLAPTDERFIMAKACKEILDLGTAKVDYAAQGGGEASADGKPPF